MTSVVRYDMFSDDIQKITPEEAYQIANEMAVSPRFFAAVSCNGDGVLGLKSHCQSECDVDPFNSCARASLWQALYRVQQETEAMLGWTLGPRYVSEDLPIREGRYVQLTYGGVNEANVAPLVSDLDYGPVEYSPILVTGASALAVAGKDYYKIQVSRSVVDNPHSVMIRKEDASGDASNGSAVIDTDWPVNPTRELVGDEYFWNIFVPGQFVDDVVTDRFSIIHCRVSYIDAPDPSELECSGEVWPVYYGTTQKIPYFKSEVLDTGEVRYWVYTRDMIDPAFDDDYADISSGEFYKFVPQVEFKCFGKVQQLAVVTKRIPQQDDEVGVKNPVNVGDCDGTPCTTVQVYACATLINKQLGIVALEEVDVELDDVTGLPVRDEDGNVVVTRRTTPAVYEGEPITVNIAYHTDPRETGINLISAIETLRRAIAARVAAEVPLGECGCNVQTGYFYEMSQELDTTLYTPSGATIVSLSYGKRKGQLVYASAIYTAPKLSKATIL